MSVGQANAAAVVVARQFNPSVASQKWLEGIGLLKASDLELPFAFTSAFSQFTTMEFSFLLVPERLQFTLQCNPGDQKTILLDKLAKFVRSVPHTPYSGVGLNLTYHVLPADGDTRELTRAIFFVPDSPLHKEFDATDARFGGYMSRDVLGCRLKLTVRPAFEQTDPESPPKHFILMDFNFHHEISPGPDAAEQIVRSLEKWDEARALAERLVFTVIARDKK